MYSVTIDSFLDDINVFSKTDYSKETKEKILAFLCETEPNAIYGRIYDRVTKSNTFTDNMMYEAENFFWTDADIYHIEKYNASVTEKFMEFIMAKG